MKGGTQEDTDMYPHPTTYSKEEMKNMKTKSFFAMLALLVIASMVLAACGGGAVEEPMEEPMEEPTEAPAPATEAPAPTEAPTEEPVAGTPADTIIIGTTDTISSFGKTALICST